MWLSDRRTLLAGLAGAMLVTGCGFTPAYAPDAAANRLTGQVIAAAPYDRISFVFAGQVEERFGNVDAAPYELRYTLIVSSTGLARTTSQSTLRYYLNGTVNFQVVERATGRVLTSGSETNFTSYSAIGTTVATRAQQKDAAARLMRILADQVTRRMIATAGTWLP
jgi:LPS-assembly lipoprotein